MFRSYLQEIRSRYKSDIPSGRPIVQHTREAVGPAESVQPVLGGENQCPERFEATADIVGRLSTASKRNRIVHDIIPLSGGEHRPNKINGSLEGNI